MIRAIETIEQWVLKRAEKHKETLRLLWCLMFHRKWQARVRVLHYHRVHCAKCDRQFYLED